VRVSCERIVAYCQCVRVSCERIVAYCQRVRVSCERIVAYCQRVSAWLTKAIDFALRCNVRVYTEARPCPAGVASAHLQGVAATPITVMGDAEVDDQAPAARLVS
jgi:hypothetical protein